jgi:hypothetical protein
VSTSRSSVSPRARPARTALAAALFFGLGAPACLDEGGEPEGGEAGGASGGEIASHDFCPSPDEPRVHYQSQDPNACLGVLLACDEGQNGFQNRCGCGCIDKGPALCPAPFDPAIFWHSTDPARCTPDPPACPLGQHGFSGVCGCGCMIPGS